jgi:hypothetical protein
MPARPGDHDGRDADDDADAAQPDDLDGSWAQIVAGLDDVDAAADEWADDGRTASPASGAPGGRVVRRARSEPAPDPAGPEPTGRDWDGTAQYDDAEAAVDDLEHFVPPDPGPVLGGDPLLTTAWALVVGALALFFVMLVVWTGPPGWLPPVTGAAFALGLGVLVWRMPHRRDGSDDDHGARV